MQLTALSLALSRIAGGWSPISLFAAGEQGAWYQPSDLSTLYQDSSGTTPVTGVEQRVGLMLDKSGRGNHAFQATTTPNDKRPVLSARVNLLTKTEKFDDAVWSAFGTKVVTPNTVIAPNGTQTGSTLACPAGNGIQQQSIPITAGATYQFSLFVKATTGTQVRLQMLSSGGTGAVYNQLLTINSGISIGNGWYRLTASLTTATGDTQLQVRILNDGAGNPIYIWGADLRPSNIGNNIPVYQRVNTATDYDTAGFPYYLKADGTYTSMSTNSVDFSATAQMTVVSGVRKLSDATLGIVTELSANAGTNFGSFFLSAPRSTATADFGIRSLGTVLQDATTGASYVSPISNVLTGQASISTPLVNLRVNGAQAATSSASQGTGNYGNYPLYIFARNNASLFFNGQFYGAIIRGATTSGNDLISTESYMNTQSGGLY